jgi:SAM-dependent methyltransferase
MFSWFRSQAKVHGILTATRLLARVVRYRLPVVIRNDLLPATLECPCCGWQGRRFLDYIEVGYHIPNAACPQCDSHSRHRAFYLWLKNEFRIADKSGRALIFAPERALLPIWNGARQLAIIKTDLHAERDVDMLSDVARLPIADRSISLIWCHHVLEQVPDDKAAMGELLRVLQPDGELIISAGSTGRITTEEFGTANQMFSGNQRAYGADFGERLQAAGFNVSPQTYNLTDTELKRYGIYPETFYRCTKGA